MARRFCATVSSFTQSGCYHFRQKTFFKGLIDNPQLSRLDEPDEEEVETDLTDKWIEVSGCGIREGLVGVDADFTIDYSGADKGSLSVESRGPAKLDLCCAYSELLLELCRLLR